MIRVRRGSPGELHALNPFEPDVHRLTPVQGVEVWRCEPDSSAIVLGSRQSEDIVDGAACRRAGLDVAKRRSGGGAVLIVPDDIVWIDVVAARGWMPDDVRASMIMVGECWRQALIEARIDTARIAEARVDQTVTPDEMAVHRGGMVASGWSDLVCFAGIGPGEVLRNGTKLVGLSQRRTREGVRIQGLIHRRSDLRSMRALFAVESPVDELVEPACLPGLDAVSFTELLAHRLIERLV
jgi:lipoate-protein ligase A